MNLKGSSLYLDTLKILYRDVNLTPCTPPVEPVGDAKVLESFDGWTSETVAQRFVGAYGGRLDVSVDTQTCESGGGLKFTVGAKASGSVDIGNVALAGAGGNWSGASRRETRGRGGPLIGASENWIAGNLNRSRRRTNKPNTL